MQCIANRGNFFSYCAREALRCLLIRCYLNVSNDLIMSYTLDHYDQVSYKSVDNHHWFHICFLTVLKKSVLLRFISFHIFLKIKYYIFLFPFSYRAHHGTRYFFLVPNWSYHHCKYAGTKSLIPGMLMVSLKSLKCINSYKKCLRWPVHNNGAATDTCMNINLLCKTPAW